MIFNLEIEKYWERRGYEIVRYGNSFWTCSKKKPGTDTCIAQLIPYDSIVYILNFLTCPGYSGKDKEVSEKEMLIYYKLSAFL